MPRPRLLTLLLAALLVQAASATPSALQDRAVRLDALAARAGSHLPWASSWEEASARAAAERKPVLLFVWRLAGFSEIPDSRVTLLSDADLSAAITEHTVPLWWDGTQPLPLTDPERYGIGPAGFGQALFLLLPDGEVVLESNASSSGPVVAALLARGLPQAAERQGRTLDPSPSAALARFDARTALVDEQSLTALERTRAFRLAYDEASARAALRLAAAEAGDEAAREAVQREALRLALGAGDHEAARAAAAGLVDASEATVAAEAELALLLLELDDARRAAGRPLQDGDPAVARAREGLAAFALARPDEPLAWTAAALHDSPLLVELGRGERGWPPLAPLSEATAFVLPVHPRGERVQGTEERRVEALEGARGWLLEAQLPDGTWTSPSALSHDDAEGPNPFVDAVTALATRALLEAGGEDAFDAVGGGLAATNRRVRARAESPGRVWFMDYTPWSAAMQVELFAAALEAGRVDAVAADAVAGALLALQERAVTGGGWSYYLTNDLGGAGQPPHAISFTTAAVVHALARLRDAGVSPPEALLEDGAETLAAMRGADGTFAYFLYHGAEDLRRSTGPAGAVGRGPVCERALARANSLADPRARYDDALRRFLEHSHLYDAERGKAVMHAGPDAQGCHYLLFDYAHAAAAWRRSSRDEGARVRLLELVLGCRLEDGSFQDTPILGRPYGTAMALLALDALAPAADPPAPGQGSDSR